MQNTETLRKLFLPRLSAILFITLFMSTLALGPRMLNIDGDLPRHLLMGKVVLETGRAPLQEIFSYVYEGRTYIPHEWLAGVIFYLIYLITGLDGIVLLAGILIASTFAILHFEASQENRNKLAIFLLFLLGASVSSIHWITRPHLFTMLFLAVWLILLDRLYRNIPVKIWIPPAIMLLWANIHAEFIAGFIVLVAYIAGWTWQFIINGSNASKETGKRLLQVAFLSFIASLFNPVGLRTWNLVIGYLNNRYLLSRIVETRPPDFTQGSYWPLLLMLGIAVYLMARKKFKLNPAHLFLLLGFGGLSLSAARNVHLAGVVFPFVLSNLIAESTSFWPLKKFETILKEVDDPNYGNAWPIMITVLASTLIVLSPLSRPYRFEPSVFPVNAVSWLKSHSQNGNMFNAFDWGGYILFHLWPEQKVFIESQGDLTGELTMKYEKIVSLDEGWQEIFDEYDITWAIIPPGSSLAEELASQGWKPVYQDQTAVVLVEN